MTVLLIFHLLAAVVLLGAVTHQAFAASRHDAGRGALVSRIGPADPGKYCATVAVLFLLTSFAGALLYPEYRLVVRPVLAELDLRPANGAFEVKEHLTAIGLGILPMYWAFWKHDLAPVGTNVRLALTWILTFVVWWNFLVGAILNNIQGLFR